MRIIDDLKVATVLAGAFGVAAACAAPLLLPALPPKARELPMPLPIFCLLLALQMTVVYGLLALAGLRLARARGLSPTAWSARGARDGVCAGLLCGLLLIFLVGAIQRVIPGTLPRTLHPTGFAAALVASLAGSLGEEILFRLFALSLLMRLLPAGRVGMSLSVVVSSLMFGAAHAPALVALFGGLGEVPLLAWAWLIALNGLCGVTFGAIYLRHGIYAAILAHFATDLLWHVASQLLRT
jgi:hypothetical protein